ncbi:J domain-containing protein [Methylomicrobium sp. RS1]|jgi:curved DNA-binding protein CbpA|uniref:J domain-containing protein n=1 Tax=Candidatus Methylomicrobium oryzae TaxID=2802053 RepID=UPI001924EFEE|nr:J domain-containing protein [Methylomicrobium sp. RS1]MBL1263838.1 DnaJ domain-containing protein [Methylomicrobium sp. RS1]
MEPCEFKDFYEILEISPNANSDTIDRVFRYLAQRYHPDIQETGDSHRFADIVQAHETLRNPEQRARYDIEYRKQRSRSLPQPEDNQNPQPFYEDGTIRERLLLLLYFKRRHNMNNPGLGNLELERLSGCPREHLEFHLWYLKEKGWIARMENGLLSITVHGVDHSNQETRHSRSAKLLTVQPG